MNHSAQTQKGFSLVETLFAIAILMIALVGPMTLAWSSLSSANDQRNEVTAAYLAQESIEYAKNIWSRNSVQQIEYATSTRAKSWLNGLDNCRPDKDNSKCDIRPNSETDIVKECTDTSCRNGFPIFKVTYSNGSSIYTSDSGSNNTRESTPFKRETVVTVTKRRYGDPEEAMVTTTVTWKNHAIPRTLTVSSVLYNY